MKKIGVIILMLLSVVGFTQSKQADKIKISSAKVDKATKLSSILDVDINNCKIESYHFTGNLGSTVKSLDVKGGDITESIKTIVKALKPGDKFTIENVKYSCTPDYKKNFIFVII